MRSVERTKNQLSCFICGGGCCKHFPGTYAPSDFGDGQNEIRGNVSKAILKGNVIIDMLDNGQNRVRPVGDNDLDPNTKAKGGKCVHLGVFGCKLSLKNRPLECAAYIPKSIKEDFGCNYGSKKRREELADAVSWADHQDWLEELR